MRLVILGGPGAGKGTQAQMLSVNLNIPCISIGDILRETIAAKTELGNKAKPFVEKGELVPDQTMIAFVKKRLLFPDISNGWVIDGYPRTSFQAEELDFLLDELEQSLNWAIYINVSEDIMFSRSLERSRHDDTVEIVQRRINLFHQRTIPILEYYDRRKRLLTIPGDRTLETVQENILSSLVTIN